VIFYSDSETYLTYFEGIMNVTMVIKALLLSMKDTISLKNNLFSIIFQVIKKILFL